MPVNWRESCSREEGPHGDSNGLRGDVMNMWTYTAVSVIAYVLHAPAALTPGDAARLAAAARVVEEMRETVPQLYWDRARCVAVIPDLKKAAFVIGGEYGKGVMSCR